MSRTDQAATVRRNLRGMLFPTITADSFRTAFSMLLRNETAMARPPFSPLESSRWRQLLSIVVSIVPLDECTMERLYETVRYDMSTGMQQLTLGKSCDALRTAFCLGCQKHNLFGVHHLYQDGQLKDGSWCHVMAYKTLQSRSRLSIAHMRRSCSNVASRPHALIVSKFRRRRPISVSSRANINPKPGTLEAGFGRQSACPM